MSQRAGEDPAEVVANLVHQRARLIAHLRVLVSSPLLHPHNAIYVREVLAEFGPYQFSKDDQPESSDLGPDSAAPS